MEFRRVLHARLRTQNIGKVWTRLNRYPYLFGVEHLSRLIAAKTCKKWEKNANFIFEKINFLNYTFHTRIIHVPKRAFVFKV